MSLFKWSTPERQRAGRILPIIPNEIYFYIFELVTPSSGRPTTEQLKIFTRLSRVCRFFANYYLPRIFEFIEFSGDLFSDGPCIWFGYDRQWLRVTTLCTQILVEQPLALALAKTVRVCCFTRWRPHDVVRTFANKYIAGMSQMRSIRELKFCRSFVDAEHWNAIAMLESLEQLSFDACEFLQGPADAEHEIKVKVKSPYLGVVSCTGPWQPLAVIDTRYLRTLVSDFGLFDHADWFSQSAVTELRLYFQSTTGPDPGLDWCYYIDEVHSFLTRVPPSLEALWLFIDAPLGITCVMAGKLFGRLVRENLPLRSLTLRVARNGFDTTYIVSSVLDGIRGLPSLRSLTLLKDYCITTEISPTELQGILHDKLGPASSLNHVDIYERVLRLVDGKWSEVSSAQRNIH